MAEIEEKMRRDQEAVEKMVAELDYAPKTRKR